jgi:NAD(P)-dependent dehydrogenase (short-subunit alcohol dehydrogenase family)
VSVTTSDTPLRDRVALVTGAGRGIGRQLVVGLARAGAHQIWSIDDLDTGSAQRRACVAADAHDHQEPIR